MAERIDKQDSSDTGRPADGTSAAEHAAGVPSRSDVSLGAQESPEPGSPPRKKTSRSLWLLLLTVAAVVVLAPVVVLVFLGLGTSTTTATAAAAFALKPATGPAPAAGQNASSLDARVDGLAFPDLAARFGWRATGVRNGSVGGHAITTVYYKKAKAQIALAIVGGPALTPPTDALPRTADGIQFHTFAVSNRNGITWERNGRTCVLVGSATQTQLIEIATWTNARSAG